MSGSSTVVVRDEGILGAGIKNEIKKLQRIDCNTVLIRTITVYKCIVEINKLSMQEFLHIRTLEKRIEIIISDQSWSGPHFVPASFKRLYF